MQKLIDRVFIIKAIAEAKASHVQSGVLSGRDTSKDNARHFHLLLISKTLLQRL